MPVDLTIRDALVLDGTGAPAFRADVAVDGGRIAAVAGDGAGDGGGAGAVPAGRVEVDAAGRVLAPGFVDTHTHDDGALLAHPDLRFKLAQGCTSLVVGNCGFSPFPAGGSAGALWGRQAADIDDLAAYRQAVAAARPACNAVALVGHNALRTAALGEDQRRPPTADEQARMRAWVEAAMEHGACGLSTGLIYRPGRWSDTEEVVDLARPVGAAGGVYATHMRNEADHLLDAVDETLRIGSEAGCAVHISHHKAAGRANWGRVADSLARVDGANAAGGDVTLDVYPYTAGSGRMIEYFDLDHPSVELAEVIRLASCPAFPDYEGRMLVDVAADTGEPLDVLVRRILTAPRGDRTICIQFLMDEADVETNLRHPLVMIGSDGIPDLGGRPHPRLYGTMPRVLGEYVRQRGILPLEEAVRRMTSLACDRFGLADRGRVAEGLWADLVLFDPATVRDTATYDDPQQEPVGIDLVVVNGEVAYDHGRHTGAGAGRLLHYRRTA